MQYSYLKIPIQQLPSGDGLSITIYKFTGTGNKKIYIQANIHGPEVTGVLVAKKLVDIFKATKAEAKEIVIVPTCNPMGLNAQFMGQQLGYINQLSGSNWNRIYPKIHSKSELKAGLKKSVRLEDKLGYKLLDLAWDADVVIDLHTAWGKAPHYVYCFAEEVTAVKNFGVENIFILDKSKFEGVFDEAIYFPKNKSKHVFTLELGSDCSLGKCDIDAGLDHILSYLTYIGVVKNYLSKVFTPEFDICQVKDYQYIYSPAGGLVVWNVSPGEFFKKGQLIANILKLSDLKYTPIRALSSGKMIIQFNAKAVHQGQAICKVMTGYIHQKK